MLIHANSHNPKRRGPQNDNREWRDSSPGVGYANNRLTDESHHNFLAKHNDLWRHIILKYKKEASTPIVGLGPLVVSPLIELSQWGYPIIYVADAYDKVVGVKKDNEIQAGDFQKIYETDFLYNVPMGAVITFIGVAEYLPKNILMRWLDLLTRRAKEIVFAVPNDRDWARELVQYKPFMVQYPKGDYYLIGITHGRKVAPKLREKMGDGK